MHTLWPITVRKISNIGATSCQNLRHQIRFTLDPVGGAYSAPAGSLAVFKGPTSKGVEGKGWEEKWEGRKGREVVCIFNEKQKKKLWSITSLSVLYCVAVMAQ